VATPEQIIVAHQGMVEGVRTRVENYAKFAWQRAGSWRDQDVDRLVALIVPRVQAGQVKTAQLTAAYLAALETARTGVPVAAAIVNRELVTMARAVPAEVVYRRPAKTMYKALTEGATLTQAVSQGLVRLQSLVATDHQLAKTTQSRESMTDRGFTFMRRVLTGRENCALCAIASTQRYRVQDLLPIHPNCDCSVDTVEVSRDPGQVIDSSLLELVHSAVEAKTGQSDRGARDPDYRDLLLVREHGELGPVLTWRKDNFTGPGDLPTA